MSDHQICAYILDGQTVIPADLKTWARWFETANRRVAEAEIGGRRVSTVFLGIDHQIGDGPPLIFETMVFGNGEDQGWMERCSTWDEAEAMHKRGCAWVKSNSADPVAEAPLTHG